MINSIKFRMGSGLSIPIHADWIKVNSLNPNEDRLVISAVNGVPTDVAIALEEMPINFVIFASNNIEFSSVDQDLEHVYNAMEFDLCRRSMTIGFADLMQLSDLDRWRYLNGIPVELQLSMRILEDEDGVHGFAIKADDDVSAALLKNIQSVAGDNYAISVPNNVETIHSITNRANLELGHGMTDNLPIQSIGQTLSDTKNNNISIDGNVESTTAGIGLLSTYLNSLQFDNSAEVSRLVSIGSVEDDMIQVTGSGANFASLTHALDEMSNRIASPERLLGWRSITAYMSILQNDDGELCLVLRMPDDLEPYIPCEGITVPSNTMNFTYDWDTQQIEYELEPLCTTDPVSIESSDETIIGIIDGQAYARGLGEANITISCGQHSATIHCVSEYIMDRTFKSGYGFANNSGDPSSDPVYDTETSSSVYCLCAGPYVESLESRKIHPVVALPASGEEWVVGSNMPMRPYELPSGCVSIIIHVPPSTSFLLGQYMAYAHFYNSRTSGGDIDRYCAWRITMSYEFDRATYDNGTTIVYRINNTTGQINSFAIEYCHNPGIDPSDLEGYDVIFTNRDVIAERENAQS